MLNKTNSIAWLLFFLVLSSTASASQYYGYFVDIDSNQDEYVTYDEFYQFFDHLYDTDHIFYKIDTNEDHLLNYDEWRYFKKVNNLGNRKRYEYNYLDSQGFQYIFSNPYWYKIKNSRKYRIHHGYDYYDRAGYRYILLYGRWYKSGKGYWYDNKGRYRVRQWYSPQPSQEYIIVRPYYDKQKRYRNHVKRRDREFHKPQFRSHARGGKHITTKRRLHKRNRDNGFIGNFYKNRIDRARNRHRKRPCITC